MQLADLPYWQHQRLGDIQRRRSRVTLPSRPTNIPQLGQLEQQGISPSAVESLSQLFVFGPMMIFAGMNRNPPPWVRTGMLVIGIGTVAYHLWKFIGPTPELGQMSWGPMHKTGDIYRPTLLTQQLATRPRGR